MYMLVGRCKRDVVQKGGVMQLSFYFNKIVSVMIMKVLVDIITLIVYQIVQDARDISLVIYYLSSYIFGLTVIGGFIVAPVCMRKQG